MNKRIHLIANAHIDSVWQWEWEEGAAETLSTFRTAADICERYPHFIFNHNEAQLYHWIDEYEPALSERITALVHQGRWHVMGGWYNQPDCNMPRGEALLRQVRHGKRFFESRYGTYPETVTNFDSFGHSRGLVQLLAKTGTRNYLFCRPSQTDCPLPAEAFIWVGLDGSRILAQRVLGFYNSQLGHATEKIQEVYDQMSDNSLEIVLWGVGDHGGGPSMQDVFAIEQLIEQAAQAGDTILHSTPDRFFAELRQRKEAFPEHHGDLNTWGPGCYTSQSAIKQAYSELENALSFTETIASHAMSTGLTFPKEEIESAQIDLLTAQFHDTLPGTTTQPVEQSALRGLYHGLEILSRVRARSFFALTAGQEQPAPDEIPIFVYNPHPFPVKGEVSCEFMLWDQNWSEEFSSPTVYQNGRELPSQAEKECSNIPLDWRKRVVFEATLAPTAISAFRCKLRKLPQKPVPAIPANNGQITLGGTDFKANINPHTGLLDALWAGKTNLVGTGAASLQVLEDTVDPWSMRQQYWSQQVGVFALMPPEEGSRFSGIKGTIPSVRVIEDGLVRSVVEAVLAYQNSRAVIRYIVPKNARHLDIEVRLQWAEKQKMVKLCIPTLLENADAEGETMFGTKPAPDDGREFASQRHITVSNETHAVSVLKNGNYGASYGGGALGLTLLRSPAYAAHPIRDREILPQDRFTPHTDQGEHLYCFRLLAGEKNDMIAQRANQADAFCIQPYALSFFPGNSNQTVSSLLEINNPRVQLCSLQPLETEEGLLLHLLNTQPIKQPFHCHSAVMKFSGAGELDENAVAAFKLTAKGLETLALLA